ncbi:dolichyl-diphosphooligosaccharide-protein glycotransferase [Pelomyxa schiedti]|nr:dolichyl-diphosphooligosaccharide-protein glycotransferase [Pelomyxa schiedti]
MRFAVLLVALASLLSVSLCAPPRTLRHIGPTLKDVIYAAGQPKSSRDFYERMTALAALGYLPREHEQSVCENAVSHLQQIVQRLTSETKSADIVIDLDSLLGISVTFGCELQIAEDTIMAIADTEAYSTLDELFYAVKTLEFAAVKGIHLADDVTLAEFVEKIMELESDGYFLTEAASQSTTLFNTGLALSALGKLHKLGANIEDVEKLQTMLDVIFDQLQYKNKVLGFWSDGEEEDRVRVTSALFSGLVAFSEVVKFDVPEAKISDIQRFLLRYKPSSPSEAYWQVMGLISLHRNPFAKIIASVEPLETSFLTGETANLVVGVFDLMGVLIQDHFLVLLTGKTSHEVPRAFIESTPGVYSLAVPMVEPGYYETSVTASASNPEDKYIALESLKISFTALGVIDVPSVETNQTNGKLIYPAKYTDDLVISPSSPISFTFSVLDKMSGKPMSVQQAALLFTSGDSVIQPPATLTAPGVYSVVMNPIKFSAESGKYKISLVAGDIAAKKPVEWELGTAAITFTTSVPTGVRDAVLSPKPAIEHKFSVPARRPGIIVWSTFTGLVCLPFVVLVFFLLHIGVSLVQPANFLATAAFAACICSYAALLVAYWLWLNMLQTLFIMALLAVPTMLSARAALLGRSGIKVKQP